MSNVVEERKKWVEALRSGKYKQGKNHLREGNSFCCLGVLCDVRDPDRWDESGTWSNFSSLVPSPQACEAVGLQSHGSFFVTEAWLNDGCPVSLQGRLQHHVARPCSLIQLNDEVGFTFEEIADVIESDPPGMFTEDE